MTSFHVASLAFIGATLLTLAAAPSFAATAQSCPAAIAAAKAEWRSLSHGINIAAAQPIVTSDGRRLNGTQVNYARVLIGRAEDACSASNHAEALGYISEAETLLHPVPRR